MRFRDVVTLAGTGLLLLACVNRSAQTQGPYGPQAGCADGPPTCSMDRRGVMQCQRGQWVPLQACPGPQGCAAFANGAIQCDPGQAQVAAAPAAAAQPGVGQPCAAEGGYDCTPDRRALTICRGGRTALASTCRGARGCVVGSAVDCDHSIAMVGDPCESPKEIACGTDQRQFLRCSGSTYQLAESCRNACLSTGGRVLCQ